MARWRQTVSDFAPLVAMAVPITAQVLCQSRRRLSLTLVEVCARITQRRSLSNMNFLETSGILLPAKKARRLERAEVGQSPAVGTAADLLGLRPDPSCCFQALELGGQLLRGLLPLGVLHDAHRKPCRCICGQGKVMRSSFDCAGPTSQARNGAASRLFCPCQVRPVVGNIQVA